MGEASGNAPAAPAIVGAPAFETARGASGIAEIDRAAIAGDSGKAGAAGAAVSVGAGEPGFAEAVRLASSSATRRSNCSTRSSSIRSRSVSPASLGLAPFAAASAEAGFLVADAAAASAGLSPSSPRAMPPNPSTTIQTHTQTNHVRNTPMRIAPSTFPGNDRFRRINLREGGLPPPRKDRNQNGFVAK